MNNTQYIIFQALRELNLLSSRIDKAITNPKLFVDVWKSDEHRNVSADAMCKDASSRLQSINDLIRYRSKIKAAIMQGNGTTNVEIGSKIYTIAEAISVVSKEDIEDKKTLLETLKEQYACANNKIVNFNASTEVYIKKNYCQLVGPNKVEEVIHSLEQEIDNFKQTSS
jgi:hypothetical protein